MFPMIATAPSRHYQDAELVGGFVEQFGLELALQPDGIQAHILHVAELVRHAEWVGTNHHVRSPSGAADQDVLAIDLEETLVAIRCLFRDFRSDLTDAKLGMRGIGNLTLDLE